MDFCPHLGRNNTQKKKKIYQDEDKSPQQIKINSQIKKPHLKMIPIKRQLLKFGTDLTMEDQIKIIRPKNPSLIALRGLWHSG